MTERAAPGDHFSGVAAGYAAFRPRYPRALFDRLVALVPRRGVAWDCAAGTGQATIDLAARFDHVVGSDVSASQIANAPRHDQVDWYVARAEAPALKSGSVDFIAVAQALHWFDRETFFAEVRRVAADGGVIAVWSYNSAELDGPFGEAYSRFEFETVGSYWPAERQFVRSVYRTFDFPFDEVPFAPMRMEEHWTRRQVLGYMRTWSATTKFIAAHGVDPTEAFDSETESLWPNEDERRAVRWALTVRVGRISKHS